MRRVLGLDLGSSSIGWAIIEEDGDQTPNIVSMGSRIIPLSPDDAKEFTTGLTISKNAKRTLARTQRKGYDRYQLRRKLLTDFLRERSMLPTEELIKLEKNSLWSLRARATTQQITLQELGRVLYHLNQKRGYNSVREDDLDKKQKDYVQNIIDRHKSIVECGYTIGQYFYSKLSQDKDFRTKEQVFPRSAYKDEFDRIISCQKSFYPTVLDDSSVDRLRNYIIYYQRSLKSCKHLVSLCEFEKRAYVNKSGNIVYSGPKVAPKSSPLSQVCKIWESANNITLHNRYNQNFDISASVRRELFEFLDNNETLKLSDLYKILGIKKTDGWWAGKAIGKGLQGNKTKLDIKRALGGSYSELLKFNLEKIDTNYFFPETGEVIEIMSEEYKSEPLYSLWHLLYSIKDKDELSKALRKQFKIEDSVIVDNLFKLDFVKQGYANKSAKAMRRILPYLEMGLCYSEACSAAGFRHSESLTIEENACRVLVDRLKPIEKNTLRQPIVEKILNQMINVVNALLEKYGRFDEIRVELARELKQSREERNETTSSISKAERLNRNISDRIFKEYNLSPTRSRIQKYKMYEENPQCLYCGSPVSLSDFLNGYEVEVEHIIPRSLFFDDSLSNKVCACRKCNKEKNNRTAYDYMKAKSEGEFQDYLDRVDKLFSVKKIGKTKRERMLTSGDKIPTDFIDRQLRESQYIARKSREILTSVCRSVTATSGAVTDRLRRLWGWDKVLQTLNFDRYKLAGLTEIKHYEHKGKQWDEEVICDWSKRLDHRHHAIDALVIACTKQGYIQRINDMSTLKDMAFKGSEYQGDQYQERLSRLDRYLITQPHPATAEVLRSSSEILISFKAGKRVATPGKRYIHKSGRRKSMQSGIIVPRGALHEESVYGLITEKIRDKKGKWIEQQQVVMRYPLISIVRKDMDFIVDGAIRKLVAERFDSYTGDDKLIWKDIESNPIIFNSAQVKSVRCKVGSLTNAYAKTSRGYVKMGNNHHIAIYIDKDGKRHEQCVTFWSAVERRKYGIPIVIDEVGKMWEGIADGLPEEFLETLPIDPSWRLEVSLQQNEMFILGLEPEAFEEAMRSNDYALLNKHLYRVQKIAHNNYYFRLHIETKVDDKYIDGNGIVKRNELISKQMSKLINIRSLNTLSSYYPQKVYINLLGEIKRL